MARFATIVRDKIPAGRLFYVFRMRPSQKALAHEYFTRRTPLGEVFFEQVQAKALDMEDAMQAIADAMALDAEIGVTCFAYGMIPIHEGAG